MTAILYTQIILLIKRIVKITVVGQMIMEQHLGA